MSKVSLEMILELCLHFLGVICLYVITILLLFSTLTCVQGHGVSVSANQALYLLEKAVRRGFGEAIASMGILKLRGKLYATNLSEASRLLKKALKMNVFEAKESLAACYQWGIRVEYDPVQAFELFSDAFNGGDLLCTVELANCYDNGLASRKIGKKQLKYTKDA